MRRNLLTIGTVAALSLQGCTTYAAEPAAAIPVLEPASDAQVSAGPALWKVADEDTTIYLFGTVHALPQDVEWFNGPIATALGSAGTLVTEIPASATSDPAAQQRVAMQAMLPADQSLRTILSEEDRASYEGALTALGLPVAAFDRFEPWFAGMTLAVLPLMKSGWSAESGVEKTVEVKASAEVQRDALETLDYQIALFDSLPLESQIAFLMASADNIDAIVPLMDQMVAEWLEGDADGLAELMNQGLTDPTLAKALLYDRNANWAGWIDDRMDAPGTVFIAVGAGHLAGKQSVQDYLTERGFVVARVQ
ncbi:TraB/GumN family protein [Qipengyuania zhejiangensis]|uniref:TraB/GumN family protein n=1 Tax=Qipengyuania zhejiangensis TaxID=3077782 RepID=UPI002D7977AE|nr:TraB/GumN family protein [Qipengyuania sp. Z2]